MSDIEMLLATGLSDKVVRQLIANLGTLRACAMATSTELKAAGASAKTAARVAAAIAIGRRINASAAPMMIGSAKHVFDLLRERASGLAQEVFWAIPVNVRNKLIGDAVEIARGTVCGVEVHPREVFRVGCRTAAAGIVLAHNHPSGDPTPSEEDVELTRRLREVGNMIGIPVVDHVVVTGNGYRSIAEHMGANF